MGTHLAYGLWSSIPWVPVSLGIIYLGRRFPFRHTGWKRTLGLHVVGAGATALVSNVLMTMSFSLARGDGPFPPDFLREALAGTAESAHVIGLFYMSVVGAISVLTYQTEMGNRELRVAQMEADLADARLVTLSRNCGDLFRGILSRIGSPRRCRWKKGSSPVGSHLFCFNLWWRMRSGTALVPRPLRDASRYGGWSLERAFAACSPLRCGGIG